MAASEPPPPLSRSASGSQHEDLGPAVGDPPAVLHAEAGQVDVGVEGAVEELGGLGGRGQGVATEQLRKEAVGSLREIVSEKRGDPKRPVLVPAILEGLTRADERAQEIRVRRHAGTRITRIGIRELSLAHVEHERVAPKAVEGVDIAVVVGLSIEAELYTGVSIEQLLSKSGVPKDIVTSRSRRLLSVRERLNLQRAIAKAEFLTRGR